MCKWVCMHVASHFSPHSTNSACLVKNLDNIKLYINYSQEAFCCLQLKEPGSPHESDACCSAHLVRSFCVTHLHSHQTSQAWLRAVSQTVNGRSKQVVCVHFSFISIPTLCGHLHPPKTHTHSLSLTPQFAAFPLFLKPTTSPLIFP